MLGNHNFCDPGGDLVKQGDCFSKLVFAIRRSNEMSQHFEASFFRSENVSAPAVTYVRHLRFDINLHKTPEGSFLARVQANASIGLALICTRIATA